MPPPPVAQAMPGAVVQARELVQLLLDLGRRDDEALLVSRPWAWRGVRSRRLLGERPSSSKSDGALRSVSSLKHHHLPCLHHCSQGVVDKGRPVDAQPTGVVGSPSACKDGLDVQGVTDLIAHGWNPSLR